MSILHQVNHHIATITLNHPEKHNILTPDTIALLSDAYQKAIADKDTKIIFLKANGKNFCAGADLAQMLKVANASFEENLADAQALADLLYLIYSCKKPTIAFVQGAVRGGGIGLCATQDIIIADEKAHFAFTEVKLGLLPAIISPFVLQKIPAQKAKYFMLTAETFSATEAMQMHLIDHIGSETKALEIADKLQQHPSTGLTQTKSWLQTLNPMTQKTLNEAAHQLATARMTDTAKEKIQRFLTS